MKDNHTWVICAYGKSDYLEACIQSLKNQTLQSQIICYSSTPLDSIKTFVSVMLSHFIRNKVEELARIGITPSLL